jgi:hypothetical protein
VTARRAPDSSPPASSVSWATRAPRWWTCRPARN